VLDTAALEDVARGRMTGSVMTSSEMGHEKSSGHASILGGRIRGAGGLARRWHGQSETVAMEACDSNTQSSNASTSDSSQPLPRAQHRETATASTGSTTPSTVSADVVAATPSRVNAARPTATRNACVDPKTVEAALAQVTRPALDHLGIQAVLDPESSSGAPSPRGGNRRCGGWSSARCGGGSSHR
jgi:hypothetical protein